MTVLSKLLTCLTLVLAALPASASLPQLARHLEATETMTAAFTQIAADGATAEGKVYLKRPGKIRFQYEDGIPLLVVADGRSLDMVDYEVRQVQKYPIKKTPLAVLLDAGADLEKYAKVKSSTDSALIVEARDRKHPEYGVITLYFAREAAAPAGLSLQGWRVLDSQGNSTRVELSDVKFNVAVPRNAFRYNDPRRRGRRGR